MRHIQLARGARKELTAVGIPLTLALVAAVVWPGPYTFLPTGLLTALFALLLYFFRDPERTAPAGEGLLLAPADGRVVEVEQVHEPRFLEGEALKISIFMSLLDVHVNRTPIEGQVTMVEHIPGQFLQAFRLARFNLLPPKRSGSESVGLTISTSGATLALSVLSNCGHRVRPARTG